MQSNFYITIEIPLNNWTGYSGKESYKNAIRIKERPIRKQKLAENVFEDYHFIEWQINCKNIGINGDLANIFYQYYKNNIILDKDIDDLLILINNPNNFIEYILFNEVGRPLYPLYDNIDNVTFFNKYPSIYFDLNRFWIEISLEKMGYAKGIQPMLYVCFPITELKPANNKSSLLGRIADSKECAYLILDSKDKQFLLETFKIFGILSESHNYDIRRILELIKKDIK